jgi:hypothetical protein
MFSEIIWGNLTSTNVNTETDWLNDTLQICPARMSAKVTIKSGGIAPGPWVMDEVTRVGILFQNIWNAVILSSPQESDLLNIQ